MATGGTGDVLAGLLGALLAATAGGDSAGQGGGHQDSQLSGTLFQRACLAVFVHGVAGERAAAQHGYSLIASDLVDELSGALASLAGA